MPTWGELRERLNHEIPDDWTVEINIDDRHAPLYRVCVDPNVETEENFATVHDMVEPGSGDQHYGLEVGDRILSLEDCEHCVAEVIAIERAAHGKRVRVRVLTDDGRTVLLVPGE